MIRYFLLTILIASTGLAEYRAYQYIVKDPISKTPSKIIISSLNPRAYIAYNSRGQLRIDLLRTWMCPGATGQRQAICPSPYGLLTQKDKYLE